MNKTISLLYKGVKNPSKVLRYGLHVFSVARNKVTRTLSARARASEEGERLVIKDVQSVRNSTDFVILAHIQRYEWITPYVKNLRCLDVGCGSGYGTHYLAENGVRMITGIDLSGSGINYANKHYKRENIDFIQMDACNLEFQDNSFDAVICFDVLEHLNEEDQIRLVSEAARVLSEHGAMYIGSPNATLSRGGNPFHLKELTKREFDLMLREFFKDIKYLGQDITIEGIRQKEDWHRCRFKSLSYRDLIIVEEDPHLCHGLLAICRNKRVTHGSGRDSPPHISRDSSYRSIER